MWISPKLLDDTTYFGLCASMFERYAVTQTVPFFDSTKPLTVVSDYAGRKSSVDVYAFIVFQPTRNLSALSKLRHIVNRADSKAKGGGRRLRFNRIRGDAVARNVLFESLPVWRSMKALVVEVAIDKSMSQKAWLKDLDRTDVHPEFEKRVQRFDRAVRRHVFQLAMTASFIFSGLSECNHIEWITDNDDAIANSTLAVTFAEIVAALMSNMGSPKTFELHGSKSRPESEVMLSLADIVAGSGVSWITDFVESGEPWQDHVEMQRVAEVRSGLPSAYLRRAGGEMLWWNAWVRPAQQGLIASRIYETRPAPDGPLGGVLDLLDGFIEERK